MSVPARDTQVGHGQANAWAYLLARAPRLARQIVEGMPGSAAMLVKVLNSLELICRITGVPLERLKLEATVETDVPRKRIVVKLR